MRKSKKAPHERFCPVGGNINPVLRDCLKSSVGWRRCVPVELCVNASRKLDDGIFPNRIIERRDENVGACCASFTNCSIHVGYEITGSLEAERIWNGCLESEDGYCSNRGQYQLRHRAAGGGRHCEYALLCGCTTEG